MVCRILCVVVLFLWMNSAGEAVSVLESGCIRPDPPERGEMFVLWSGLLVQFRCSHPDEDRLSGAAAIICRNGTWTQDPPTCQSLKNPTAEQGNQLDPIEQKDQGSKSSEESNNKKNKKAGNKKQPAEKTAPVDNPKKNKDDKLRPKNNKPKVAAATTTTTEEPKMSNEELDLSSLDQTCLMDGSDNVPLVPAPPVPHSTGNIKYVRRRNKGSGNNRYAAAIYQCSSGYSLAVPETDRLFCRQGSWIGPSPICAPKNQHKTTTTTSTTARTTTTTASDTFGSCGEDNKGGCEHICQEDGNGRAVCLCYRGYVLSSDQVSCIDVDECSVDNGGCEGQCTNRQGSFQCSCSDGFRLASNGKKCIDHNECLLRNGHGPCQGSCRNTHGSYECSCEERPGTQLAADGHSCEDLDECVQFGDNFGCSHTCLNTLGTAFCTCPDGYMLGDDWKTCEDIDECELEDVGQTCAGSCINTIGSFRCSEEDASSSVELDEEEELEEEKEIPSTSSTASTTTTTTVSTTSTTTTTPSPPVEENSIEEPVDVRNPSKEDDEDLPEIDNDIPLEALHKEEDRQEEQHKDRKEEIEEDQSEELHKEDQQGSLEPNEIEEPKLEVKENEETKVKEQNETEEVKVEPKETEGSKVEPEKFEESKLEPEGSKLEVKVIERTKAENKEDEEEGGEEDEDEEEPEICPQGYRPSDLPPDDEDQDPPSDEEEESSCVDIDECSLPDNYGCSHICINTKGSARCDCPVGWKMADDLRTCLDIDECMKKNFGCSHQCVNTEGSAYCSCPSGYSIRDNSPKTCADLDECSDPLYVNFGCSHICVNLNGSAECACPPGFKLRPDQKNCKDIDECATDNGGCSHQCVNLKGGMKCGCPDGYLLSEDDSKTCEDVDECLDTELVLPCRSTGGFCINTAGSFTCSCPEGFQSSGTHCSDVDECKEDPSPCETACTNLPGSYRCDCDEGFESNGNGTCTDVDECPRGVCDQLCTNIPGSYICDCHPGFELIGDICQDVDECARGTHSCQGICVNTVGSFECQCQEGYHLLDGDRCIDVDECLTLDPCQGICINTQGSYSCSCEIGYQLGENGTCSDIDECASNPCPVECINSEGSYSCLCPSGYSFIDQICQDVNECLLPENPCGASSKCINTEGSFQCECEPGFIMSRTTRNCEDIDECKINPCNGACINLPGSYQCICDPGYELRQGRCEDINECENYKCGGRCVNLPGSYLCECDKGYKLEGDVCVDENECVTQKPCKGRCVNLIGSYRCECDAGYRPERHDCIDIDECSERNGGCAQLCVNTAGSFHCACQPGFEVGPRNKSHCVDVNECRTGNGGCSQDCLNTRGSYRCTCSDRYYLSETDGKSCLERPARCPALPPPDHGVSDCSQGPDTPHLQYQEDEPVADEPVVVDRTVAQLGPITGWSASRFSTDSPPIGFNNSSSKLVVVTSSSRKLQEVLFNAGSTCSVRCNKGFKLVGDSSFSCDRTGHWLGEPATCIPLACPKLQAPDNGLLVPHSCLSGKTFAGQQCQVRCRLGFRLITGGASPIYHCLPSQQWRSPEEPPRCERIDSPVPFIQCPGNMAVTLGAQERRAYVSFSQPKSNMDWFRYVESEPIWAKQLAGELDVGYNVITFRVRSPVSDLTATCNFTIEVFDKEIPRITNCPSSFTVYLEPGQSSQIVTWNEPIITDNIQVVHTNKSKEPGELFQAGYHNVSYTAEDASGNIAKCQFTIHVTGLVFPNQDNSSPITKVPRGRVLVRCPGSKPGKYVEMYTYKVPAGCIVINNPSALSSRPSTTPAPRLTVFDWDFSGRSSGEAGTRPNNAIRENSNPSGTAVHRLRDAAIPSAPVIQPGPSWHPSMGTSQPLRLSSRGRNKPDGSLQQTPVDDGWLWPPQTSWCCTEGFMLPATNSEDWMDNNNQITWSLEDPSTDSKWNNKKQGGAVDLLLPFTANGESPTDTPSGSGGRKRHHQRGPKNPPKPGPVLAPSRTNKKKDRTTTTTAAPLITTRRSQRTT